MEPVRTERRRNYFIDAGFQTRFIIKFCMVLIAASIFAAYLTYFLSTKTTTVAFDNLRVVVKSTADFILPTISIVFAIVTSIASLAAIFVTIITSHRIAGPAYKLTMEFDRMADGDMTNPIRIRAKDQLKEAAVAADSMRSMLGDNISLVKKELKNLKADVENSGANRELAEKLTDSIKNMESALSKFKTE